MPTGAEDDLVSPYDIAARLGLPSHRLVLEWRFRRADFPAPATRRRTYLWHWADVERWHRQHADEVEVISVRGRDRSA